MARQVERDRPTVGCERSCQLVAEHVPADRIAVDQDKRQAPLPDVLAEVTEAFLRYERALLANDVAALDRFFWESPHSVRYGTAENQYGSEAIGAFRRSRPPVDLTRDLMNTVITTFGRDFATANTEFRDRSRGATGRQSQVWVRTGAGWQIVAAHVSMLTSNLNLHRSS